MIEFLLFWCIVVVILWWMCPRIFLWADRYIARRNLSAAFPPCSHRTPRKVPLISPRKKKSTQGTSTLTNYAQILDDVARSTRSQVPARDALLHAIDSLASTTGYVELNTRLQRGDDIATALSGCPFSHQEEKFVQLLQRSLIHGSFIPQALEQSATILREEVQHQQNMQSAAAQARSTVRLLSLLPFIVLAVLLLASPTTRREITTAPTLALITSGVILNRLGWSWVQGMVARASRTSPSVSSQLSDEVSISLRAGIPLRQAIESWAVEHDSNLAVQLSAGSPFADALNEFAQRHLGDTHLIAQIFIDADRDGLPIADTVHRLSTEMRMQRRHASDIRIRQLPTQLALPMVFCVLPSFILLTVLPLVFANLHHFHFSPPSINTTS